MKSIEIKVPGKIMLAGEYAVLKGGHALASTINQSMFIHVSLDPASYVWNVESDLWQTPSSVDMRHQSQQHSDPLLQSVFALAKRHGLSGGTIRVRSDLDIHHGAGTSSALRLGIAGAMQTLKYGRGATHPSGINPTCMGHAWELQRLSQGIASGYDIATQFYGGLVEFHRNAEDHVWNPHVFKHPVAYLNSWCHVFVGGRGAPTTQTIQSSTHWLDGGHRYDRMIDLSEAVVDAMMMHLRFPSTASLRNCIHSIAMQRALFSGTPSFPAELSNALASTSGADSLWGWKTTGAGGEDAILVIADPRQLANPRKTLESLGWSKAEFEFASSGISIQALHLNDSKPNAPAREPQSRESGINSIIPGSSR
jgi:mevalonate kinase